MNSARRVPLEEPPTTAEEARVERLQKALRTRLGANLKRLRLEAGLSQRALSMRANVSHNYISRAENGQHGVSVDLLVRIAYHLGTTPAALLSE